MPGASQPLSRTPLRQAGVDVVSMKRKHEAVVVTRPLDVGQLLGGQTLPCDLVHLLKQRVSLDPVSCFQELMHLLGLRE